MDLHPTHPPKRAYGWGTRTEVGQPARLGVITFWGKFFWWLVGCGVVHGVDDLVEGCTAVKDGLVCSAEGDPPLHLAAHDSGFSTHDVYHAVTI